ncbi:Kinesin-2 [Giardia muris]|uniref:Kinesin-like protein n=1 Tax=Giardia muris TaxID=5742 RepID=A0A4Z1T9H9_GIAMU|nr:Kinesin-2 [Giardia muris]|eukprot:TNJ29181.1 Kinesin-2 [Giardia muris]
MGRGEQTDNVRVLVRMRPFNEREKTEGAREIVEMDKTRCTVTLHKPPGLTSEGVSKRSFTFDAVYPPTSTQTEVFDESVREMIDGCLEGYNATVFAYGQTGSGKTHTMMGQPENPGMIPLAFQRIFDFIAKADSTTQFLVRASFIEIYNEDIKDLLTNTPHLQLKEDPQRGVFIKGLSEHPVSTEGEIEKLMKKGNNSRAVAATLMNATSSRSHSIFQIIIERMEVIEGKETIRVGKLNLVDLAGSERQEKTGATGDRLKEAAKINLSLTTLGCVISKLVEKAQHIPYRDSKLTRLLQDSLGGNSKTLMVVAVSPASTNYDETLSTLRYADRAKQIKNKPKINEDPKDAQIREMRDYISRLEAQLKEIMNQANAGGGAATDGSDAFTGYTAEEAQQIKVLKKHLDQAKKKRTKYVQQEVEAPSQEELQKLEDEQLELERQIKKSEEKARARQELAKALTNKIEESKSKMVDRAILETEEREKDAAIREARNALAAQKVEAAKLKKQLLEAEEARKNLELQCTTASDRIQELEQIQKETERRLAEAREELYEIRLEQSRERDTLGNDREAQLRLLGLRQYVVSSFIPSAYQKLIEEYAVWDEEEQAWSIEIPRGTHH